MLRAYYARVSTQAEPEFPREQLSEYRLDRLSRTKLPGQRALSLGAELLLINAMKTLAEPRLPLDIFVRPGGKPGLKEGPCFSLSHSGDVVFCVLSDAEVGADVQKLPEAEPGQRLLERCLSEEEKQLYRESKNKRGLFTLLWSLKESYAKLDGSGLGPLAPAEISIELSRPGMAKVKGSSAKLWYELEGNYVFSLCSQKYETPQGLDELSF